MRTPSVVAISLRSIARNGAVSPLALMTSCASASADSRASRNARTTARGFLRPHPLPKSKLNRTTVADGRRPHASRTTLGGFVWGRARTMLWTRTIGPSKYLWNVDAAKELPVQISSTSLARVASTEGISGNS